MKTRSFILWTILVLLFSQNSLFADDHNALPPEKVTNLAHGSRIIDLNTISTLDAEYIRREISSNNLYFRKFGNFLIVSGDITFFILQNVFEEAEKLTDPKLQSEFRHYAEFAAHHSIKFFAKFEQDAVASFGQNEGILFSYLSKINLSTFVHEVGHAETDLYMDHLDKFISRRAWVYPASLTGPGVLGALRGFFHVLDEIHSWRIGGRFGELEALSDSKIIDNIKRLYPKFFGSQEVTKFFQIWNEQDLRSQDVYDLIRSEVFSLNEKSLSEIIQMGTEGLENADLEKQINFIRIVSKRYVRIKAASMPEDILRLLYSYASIGINKGIREHATEYYNWYLRVVDEEPLLRSVESDFSLFPSDAPFAVKWKKFLEKPTREIWEIDKKEFLDQVGFEQMRGLLDHYLKSDLESQKEFNNFIIALLKSNGFRHLKKGLQSEPIPFSKNNWFVSEQMDAWLALHVSRLPIQLLEIFVHRFTPTELPEFFNMMKVKLMDGSTSIPVGDIYLLLVPGSREVAFDWAKPLVDVVLKSSNAADFVLERVADFYRVGVVSELELPQFLSNRLDKKMRGLTMTSISKFSSAQREVYDQAIEDLWAMLGNKNRDVRLAAQFAILNVPAYLLGLEKKVHAELEIFESLRREYLPIFIQAAQPGFFSPEVEAIASLLRRTFDLQEIQPNTSREGEYELKRHNFGGCEAFVRRFGAE
ncbi:MAG: hypothetical protein J0L93_02320 [Deltaproteobacteria bacterium]|nr:hypothetical protein [Deltaproteobacteria bacterium]